MDDVLSRLGVEREQLLREARDFAQQVRAFVLAPEIVPMAGSAAGGANPPDFVADPETVALALRLAPKLALAVAAMDLEIRTLKGTIARTSAQIDRQSGDAGTRLELKGGEGMPLTDEVSLLRELLGSLVLNAESVWEEGSAGRDWKEAIDAARAALHSRSHE